MINVNEATKSAYRSNSLNKELTIIFPDINITLTNSDIVSESMVLTQIIETNSILTFQGCNASKFEIELADFEQDVRGERIVVNIKAGLTDTITIFEGIVDEQDNLNHEDITVKVVAYDKLYTIGETDVTSWYASLTFPLTVKQFRDSFFNEIGIAQETVTLPCDDLQMIKMVSADVQINARTVMQAICQANARFGMLKRGFFTYKKLQTSVGIELTKSEYINVDYDPYMMETITKVSVVDDSGITEESYGSGDNVLKIEGNMVAYSVDRAECAERIYNEVSGITMNSARIKTIGLPYMECGDYIELSTAKNDIGMFILNRTLRGIQGLFDNYDSTVDQYMHEVESLASQLLKQNGRINHFYRDLDQTKSTVANNKTDADGKFEQQQSEITQNAESITAEVTRAQGAESNLSSRITQTADSLTVQIQEIYEELDGDIAVYYREGEPTLLNYPAWDFTYNIPCNNTVQTTDSLKFIYTDEYYQQNIRATVYDTDSELTYRFAKENGAFFWKPVGDTEFSIAMQKISELEVTTEQISTTVSETVDELHGDYYTKTQTETKLTQTSDSILSTVSQNYTNSTDLSRNYTLKSTFEQTVRSITSSVEAKVDNTTFQTTIQQTADAITTEVTRAKNAENTLSSSITQTANAITTKVSKGNVSSEISQEAGAISISANRLTIDSTYFKLSANGNITATGGTIGGFTIGATALYNGKNTLASNNAGVYVGTDGIGVGFGSGYGFKVDKNGTIEIKPFGSTALKIGNNLSINQYGALTIGTVATGFSVNLTGNKVTIGGETIIESVGSSRYMSVPSGWKLRTGTTNLIDVDTYGIAICDSSSRLAFFTSSPSSGTTKQTVNKLSSSATLANVITKVNDLLTALKNYGLISSV